MNNTDLILHHYDESPFTQKTLRMLGLKGLKWYSVVTPMIMPKPDLLILTGGYRGTPVLQIGADVYVDNYCIAQELEKRFPEPSFFPNSNSGMQQALIKWSDAFFRAGLHMVIALQSQNWPEQFLADRKALFSDLDFDKVSKDIDHAMTQFRVHASLINEQLSDGRKFLLGDHPSLADIHAFSVPWFTRAAMPEVNALLADFTFLLDWEANVAALGDGGRTLIEAAEAHKMAKASTTITKNTIGDVESQTLKLDQQITIEPDDAQRGSVSGRLHAASAQQISIRHENDIVGEVVVHFPRLGYRVITD